LFQHVSYSAGQPFRCMSSGGALDVAAHLTLCRSESASSIPALHVLLNCLGLMNSLGRKGTESDEINCHKESWL